MMVSKCLVTVTASRTDPNHRIEQIDQAKSISVSFGKPKEFHSTQDLMFRMFKPREDKETSGRRWHFGQSFLTSPGCLKHAYLGAARIAKNVQREFRLDI